jgi:hypothetical protein
MLGDGGKVQEKNAVVQNTGGAAPKEEIPREIMILFPEQPKQVSHRKHDDGQFIEPKRVHMEISPVSEHG